MITATVSSKSLLNLDYVSACRVLMQSYERLTLALVGCGGTGSWLAPGVARVARLVGETLHKEVRVHFIDPDVVEAQNVYRQNFCEAEIGENKAETLAMRYGLAWGLEIEAWPSPLRALGSHQLSGGMMVFIGCVDRAQGRRELQTIAQHGGWWLDCGNHQSAGQVLLGSGGSQPGDPFKLPGFCSWLPLPTHWHPELLEDEPEEAYPAASLLSCAEMALQSSQGLAINQRVAAEATDYLVRLLLTRDLSRFATYIDLASGSSRSMYITPEILKGVKA